MQRFHADFKEPLVPNTIFSLENLTLDTVEFIVEEFIRYILAPSQSPPSFDKELD